MVQQLPVGVVNPDIPHLVIGPSSAITLSRLETELNECSAYNADQRLRISDRAMIISPDDAEYERSKTIYLASTAKGCGRALARKVMRSQDVQLARDIPWLKPFITDTTALTLNAIRAGKNVLVEGSQGFDLDIHHGIAYPYCTSRQTTPMQVLADLGIPDTYVRSVTATIRTYPIRVGNVYENGVQIGNSGPFGGREMTWDEITQRSGSPVPLIERTTVTKRVRRIFEIDNHRLHRMFDVCMPDFLAVTFADYIDHRLYGMDTDGFVALLRDDPNSEIVAKLNLFLRGIFDGYSHFMRPRVGYIKTGPDDNHTINLTDSLQFIYDV
jgi:adenylosuccinate synthase